MVWYLVRARKILPDCAIFTRNAATMSSLLLLYIGTSMLKSKICKHLYKKKEMLSIMGRETVVATLKPRHFHNAYCERVTLTDGTVAHLRLVQQTDHDLWVDAFKRLSPESRYLRFGRHKPILTESEVDYFTVLDQENHFALVGVKGECEENGEPCLGMARFIRSAFDSSKAEVAITITDDAQGCGLGFLLLARLVAAARERGVEKFDATVLVRNGRMLRLINEFAAEKISEIFGSEIAVTIKLRPIEEDETWEHMHRKVNI